jgi:hypothetical protein
LKNVTCRTGAVQCGFYIAAGNYRKKTKQGLNWQEMEMNANTGSFTLCSAPCAAKMRQIHALFTKDG